MNKAGAPILGLAILGLASVLALALSSCASPTPPDDRSAVSTRLEIWVPDASYGTICLDGAELASASSCYVSETYEDAVQSHTISFEPAPGYEFERFEVTEDQVTGNVYQNPMSIEQYKTGLRIYASFSLAGP